MEYPVKRNLGMGKIPISGNDTGNMVIPSYFLKVNSQGNVTIPYFESSALPQDFLKVLLLRILA